MKIPRSIRNRNFGNLRKSSAKWQGLVGYDLQGFCIFNSTYNGVRALYKQLRSYRLRGWLVDAKTFVKHYCPASDGNDEVSYTKIVSKCWLEYDVRTKDFAFELAFLICTVESGMSPYHIDHKYNMDLFETLKSLKDFYI